MKKIHASLLLLALYFTSYTSVFAENPEPYLVKEFNLKAGGNLQVQTAGGGISVTGTAGNKATVAVIITGEKGTTDKKVIAEALKHYTLDIRQENNTLIASARRKKENWSGNSELNISFRINVPEQTSCTLQTSGGSISLNHIKGTTNAETSGGSISLNQYAGNLKAETSGGSINLNNAEGKLDLNTSGGSIALTKVSGDVNAQTSGGSIKAEIFKLGKYLNLETTGGSVLATLPKGSGLDLDLTGNWVKADLTDFKGTSEKDKVKGKVNGGGIPVKLHTTGGTAELKFR